jgi:hypothetical protein
MKKIQNFLSQFNEISDKLLDIFLGPVKIPKFKTGDKVIFPTGALSYISGTSECVGLVTKVEANRRYVFVWCESKQMTTGYNDKLLPVGNCEEVIRFA